MAVHTSGCKGRAVLDGPATLGMGQILRSLDAIHLAAAPRLGPDLRSFITYDA